MNEPISTQPTVVPRAPGDTDATARYAAQRAQINQITDKALAEPDPEAGALLTMQAHLYELQLAAHQTIADELNRPLSFEELAAYGPVINEENQLARTIIICEKVRQHRKNRRLEADNAALRAKLQQAQRGLTGESSGGASGPGGDAVTQLQA
jgi:hypothetical protein